MNIIVKMKFGSHLYGTDTPASDLDFKGVFLPTKEEVFLGKIPKSINLSTNKSNTKNSSDDVDVEMYSLHYFLKLACAGETVALDMLHAHGDIIEEFSPIWAEIVGNRTKFYTKNLRAFVGYARRQAAKYGIKGSRLNAAKGFLNLLDAMNENVNKLSDIWEDLIEDEHRHFIESSPSGIRQYQVCGRIVQETMGIEYAYEIVSKFYKAYGHRAKQAAENKGIDWKAVSHAIRAAYQVKELLTENTITFPRPEAKLLLDVKLGKLDYLTEVGPLLDSLMEEVEELSEKSTLPEKPDRKFWDNFIVKTIEDYVL